MKILIATPLYPPDIAPSAQYVKELASRLKDNHSVTILAYNHIPEEIPGVRIIAIEKNQPLFIRLFHYVLSLYKEAKVSDCVYVQNGPSIEFPLILVTPFLHIPFFLRLGDETALSHATREKFHARLLKWAMRQAHSIITHNESSAYNSLHTSYTPREKIHDMKRPHTRPEVLPFKAFPTEALDDYEASWKEHTDALTHIFST